MTSSLTPNSNSNPWVCDLLPFITPTPTPTPTSDPSSFLLHDLVAELSSIKTNIRLLDEDSNSLESKVDELTSLVHHFSQKCLQLEDAINRLKNSLDP